MFVSVLEGVLSKVNKQLVIIGNGFDLSHGLKTSFHDFYSSLPKKIKRRWQQLLEIYEVPEDSWHNFETLISDFTNNCFNKYLDSYSSGDKDDWQNAHNDYVKEIKEINDLFLEITDILLDYINIQNKLEVSKNIELKNYIKRETPVISFNYTDLIKKYSDKIDYFHGSCEEKFIVFGYSLRTEYDFIDSTAARFDKNKIRNWLDYARFLKAKYDIDYPVNLKYLEDYLPHLLHQSTGKGGWDFDYPTELLDEYYRYFYKLSVDITPEESHIKTFESLPEPLKISMREIRLKFLSKQLNEYYELKNYFTKQMAGIYSNDLGIDLANIEEIIIIGHGLESDLEVIGEIVESCGSLKKVVIFTYSSESKQEIDRKQRQILQMRSCMIEMVNY